MIWPSWVLQLTGYTLLFVAAFYALVFVIGGIVSGFFGAVPDALKRLQRTSRFVIADQDREFEHLLRLAAAYQARERK